MSTTLANLYRVLGVRPIVNAAGHLAVLGGSVPSERTIAALADAARTPVEIAALQRAVHARLAQLTGNQAAYVTAGAAAGLYLATAAAVGRRHGTVIDYMDRERIASANVVVPTGCRSPYDVAVRQVGVELREVAGELSRAVDADTVAVLHVPAGWNPPGTPTVEQAAAVARAAQVPLIVDAAAQIPPVANLAGFTARGAEVAIFSGGKGLRAPQPSGLLIGTADFLGHVCAIGFPRHGFGRVFKVGREQLVGLLAAVEEAIAGGEEGRRSWCEQQVGMLVDAFRDHPVLAVRREFPNIAGQPLPYAAVRLRSAALLTERIVTALRDGEPSIIVGPLPGRADVTEGFIVNTLALRDGDLPQILAALRAAADLPGPACAGAEQ